MSVSIIAPAYRHPIFASLSEPVAAILTDMSPEDKLAFVLLVDTLRSAGSDEFSFLPSGDKARLAKLVGSAVALGAVIGNKPHLLTELLQRVHLDLVDYELPPEWEE